MIIIARLGPGYNVSLSFFRNIFFVFIFHSYSVYTKLGKTTVYENLPVAVFLYDKLSTFKSKEENYGPNNGVLVYTRTEESHFK